VSAAPGGPLEALVSLDELRNAAPHYTTYDVGETLQRVLREEIASGRVIERSGGYQLNLAAIDPHTVAALAELREWA